MKHFHAAGGIVVLIASGFAHGHLTDRWTGSKAVAASVSRLERVPIEVGSWKGQPMELDRAQLTIGGIAGYLTRNYVNAATGGEVTVLIVTGRSGPISLHPPEVCYAGRGYEMTSQARRKFGPIPGVAPATFSVGDLVKSDGLQADRLKIYWAWKADGPWMSPGDPRLTFARHPALYKMYVIRKVTNEEKGADACVEFLREFLPACESALSPPAGEPSAYR